MKIPYFPGCTLKTTAQNFESSALASAKKIGIEFVELDRWNCCGVVASLTSDDLMRHLAPVRNFLRVQEMNKSGIVDNEFRLVTLCSMCYNTLELSNQRMKKSADDLQKINHFIHKEQETYEGNVEVVHFLSILKEYGFNELSKQVKKPLKGLKVASYYGCTLLRPKEVGIDNAEDPKILENLVSALGAESVDWDAKSRCCGSYHTVNNVEIVHNLVRGIVNDARKNEADAIITSCPLCAFNLDVRQSEVKNNDNNFQTLPVYYFSQLMGLALEIEEKELGFEFNKIDPINKLSELNLI